MPKLGNDHYDYTPKGIAAYRRAKKKRLKEDFGTSFIAGAGAYAGTELAKAAHEKYKARSARKKKAAVKAAKNEVYERTFGLLEFKAQDPVTSTPTLGGVAKKGISLTSKGTVKQDVKQNLSKSRAGAAPPPARAIPGVSDTTKGFTPKHTETKPEPRTQSVSAPTYHQRTNPNRNAPVYDHEIEAAKKQGEMIKFGLTNLGVGGATNLAVRGVRGALAIKAAQGLRGSIPAVSPAVSTGVRYGTQLGRRGAGGRQAGFGRVPGSSNPTTQFIGGADAALRGTKEVVKAVAKKADPMKTLAGASNAANVSTGTRVVATTLATATGAGLANPSLEGRPPGASTQLQPRSSGASTRSAKVDAPSDKSSDIGATKPSGATATARTLQPTHVMSTVKHPKVTSVADKPKLQLKPASPERQRSKPVQAPEGDMGTPKPKLQLKPASPERQRSKPVQAPEGDMGTQTKTEPLPELQPIQKQQQKKVRTRLMPRTITGTQTRTEPIPELEPVQKQAEKKVRTRLMPRTITGTQTRTGTQTSPQASTQASTETATAPATEPRPSPQKSRPPERIAQKQGSSRPPRERRRKEPKAKRGRKWPILPFLAALGGGGGQSDDDAGGSGFTRRKKTRFPHADDLEGGPGPVGRRSSSSSTKKSSRSSSSKRRLAAHTIYPKMAKLFS